MQLNRHLRRRRGQEDGYILLFLLVLVTLAIIAMAAAVPAITTDIRRGKEEELIRRGHQYQRAIQLYFRKFGRYPGSIEELEQTNNIRFLRHRYKDPITGKDEWRLIHLGQAKPKKRPAYLGPDPGSPIQGTGQQPQNIGTNVSGMNTGTNPGMSPATSPTGGTIGGTGSSPGVNPVSNPSSGSNSNMPGGGPIVGVASTSTGKSIKLVDEKDHYNDWEFTYDPTLESRAAIGAQPGDRQLRGPRDTPHTPGNPTGPIPPGPQ